MFLKYSLIGLGSIGVVGGGGYMIYNATKSSDENESQAKTTGTQTQQQSEISSSGEGGSSPISGDPSTGSSDSRTDAGKK